MNEADVPDGTKGKKIPLLTQPDNTLNLEIKFTIHLRTNTRTKSELNLLETLSLEHSQLFHSQLLKDQLCSLLTTGSHSDLILVMEDDRTFAVHKAILSARSPVFAGMLRADMKESRSGIIRIKDISSTCMRSLLSYIYTGILVDDLQWNDPKQIQELIYAADKVS